MWEIAYSFGTIDLCHYGHVRALTFAHEHSDLHVLGLVSDEAARSWLGNVVSTFEERRAVAEQLKCVDRVVVQSGLSPLDNLRALHDEFPEARITLYHGNDLKVAPARGYLDSIGGRVVLTDYYERLSPEAVATCMSARAEGQPESLQVMTTKADTLLYLAPRLKLSHVEDALVTTERELEADRQGLLDRVGDFFGGCKVVVRSSCSGEDGLASSNAGHYESVLDVDSGDASELERAIRSVVDTYRTDLVDVLDEQVLIQRQTSDVAYSGVVFTRDVNGNRPYYVVNYSGDGTTDSVTAGRGGASIWIARDAKLSDLREPWLGLMRSVREVESALTGTVLDIEFAIGKTGDVTVFQARPLAAAYRFEREYDDAAFTKTLSSAEHDYLSMATPAEAGPLLSDMAFWNPAEMIGTNPHNLDYSLYRTLICSGAWNDGIAEIGYRRVPGDLMYRVGNKPYISLAKSFRALVPESVSDGLAEKLVTQNIRDLSQDWTAHDKIEFEIAATCYDLGTEGRLATLLDGGFTVSEVQEVARSLRELTRDVVEGYPDILARDRSSARLLCEVVDGEGGLLAARTATLPELLASFRRLIDATTRLGTPQFSRHARCAFIARSLCGSAVTAGLFGRDSLDAFVGGVGTIAAEQARDFGHMITGDMQVAEFVEKYGHLRLGTYDICSPAYKELVTSMVGAGVGAPSVASQPHSVNPPAQSQWDALAEELGFGTGEQIREFCQEATRMREWFKFEFTKGLSLAIEVVAAIAKKSGLSREDAAHLTVEDLMAAPLYGDTRGIASFLRGRCEQGRLEYERNADLVLPPVITRAEDVKIVFASEARPNFVTTGSARAPVVVIGGARDGSRRLSGKIVAIPKADPGYDWIFSQGIVGLITQYGGAASHMAIRCAEFGLPAAIGCGETLYSDIAVDGAMVEIDCSALTVGRVL